MKLLIITQKVDLSDDILGFFYAWINELAKHYEKVTVVSLWKTGQHQLLSNVELLSLGKGTGGNRWQYIFRFYNLIWRERRNYDSVLVHMNPEYVVLAGWLWKLWHKKVALWYVHKAVPLTLKLAEKFVDNIFTASKESCNLRSSKIRVLGHGIDTNRFRSQKLEVRSKDIFRIIYVGRISKIKNQELLIRVIDIMRKDETLPRFTVQLIGGTVYPDDEKYKTKLEALLKEKKLQEVIKFVGSVPNNEIINYYQQADLSVNLCPTGGVDKAVLESLACGVPVVVLNKSFAPVLGPAYPEMILEKEEAEELVGKIKLLMRKKINPEELRRVVVDNFSLGGLINKVVSEI